jgi:hypothetical protein
MAKKRTTAWAEKDRTRYTHGAQAGEKQQNTRVYQTETKITRWRIPKQVLTVAS